MSTKVIDPDVRLSCIPTASVPATTGTIPVTRWVQFFVGDLSAVGIDNHKGAALQE
ncbi:MAG: hypothetical protein LC733_05375 [Actinobacteria bacterium]|nr:hypothetical protein [Actinomycetota bacterium]